MKFDEAILEIKRRIDLVQVIGGYVKLKQRGNSYIGLCPFHNEKSPSFNVRADQGYFKCFGCGAGGDVFNFLEKKTGLPFFDVALKLGQDVGVEVTPTIENSASKQIKDKSAQLKQVLIVAQQYFERCLGEKKYFSAREYITSVRKIPLETAQRIGLGFGGDSAKELFQFAHERSIKLEDLLEVGLLTQTSSGMYGPFCDRITIPIKNKRGDLIAFGGRLLSENKNRPKYVNSKASAIYDKKSCLYGLHESLPLLKAGEPAVLAEGYFDVIALQQAGFAAVAPLGTSFTSEHVAALTRFSSHVILCLDNDSAGQIAQRKALLMLLTAGVSVKSAMLSGKDPDEMWHGPKRQELLNSLIGAKDALELLIRAKALEGIDGVQAKIKALDSLLPYLACHPRALVKRQYVRLAAEIFCEDEATILRELGEKPEKPKVLTHARDTIFNESERLLFLAIVSNPSILIDADFAIFSHVNRELSDFLTTLRMNLKSGSFESPAEAFRATEITHDSKMTQLMLQVSRMGGPMTENSSKKFMQDWDIQTKKAAIRKSMNDNQKILISAEAQGDQIAIGKALQNQSYYIKQLRSLKSNEQRGTNSDAQDDDGGWT